MTAVSESARLAAQLVGVHGRLVSLVAAGVAAAIVPGAVMVGRHQLAVTAGVGAVGGLAAYAGFRWLHEWGCEP